MAKEHPLLRDNDIINALEAIDEIEKLTAEDYAKIPETVFVRKLLPVLVQRDGKANLQVWNEIAGHPMRQIAVLGKDGKELFKLPPLMRRDTPLHRSKTGFDSVYEIMVTATKKDAVIPDLGVKYIERNLLGRLGKTKLPIEEIVLWNDILKRYDQPPLFKVSQAKQDEINNAPTPDIFSGEYEDF